MALFLTVAVPTVLRKVFEYRAPADTPVPSIGSRILVPYNHRTLVGIVTGHTQSPKYPEEKILPIQKTLDTSPVFDQDILSLCEFASQYYQHPIGEVFQTALPISLRKDTPLPDTTTHAWAHTTEGKGLPADALKRSPKQQSIHQYLLTHRQLPEANVKSLRFSKPAIKSLHEKGLIHKTPHNPVAAQLLAEPAQAATQEQAQALTHIRYHKFGAYLIDGATGSGKTEVYLQVIARTLNEGKQALVLVPEIGLTPQTLARFQARFSVPVIELHSNIAAQQRSISWLQAARGQARIVIGTRLSVFTPMPELGVIIVDEEHDPSYKQQDGFKYSARDMAIVRAHQKNIPILLGSATPSLETLNNALEGRFEHLRLTARAGAAKPPKIRCINMLQTQPEGPFSTTVLHEINSTLKRGEQCLVFINRRGYAPSLLCQHCGWSAVCSACDARLTLHSNPKHLRCHHCNARKPVPNRCPSCQHHPLQAIGQGTARVEEVLQSHFSTFPVIRVDQDTMQRKGAMKTFTAGLQKGEPCIVVGTQMLAKGHHFPKVTLVVLLDIDQALFSGDFRALERLGQQVTQVAGRSGRSHLPGQVLIQTYQADHPLLALLLTQGYRSLARQLLASRQASRMPPYWSMALLRAESKYANNATKLLEYAADVLNQLLPPAPTHKVLGPLPCLMEKRQDRFRFQLQVTTQSRNTLQSMLPKWVTAIEANPLARKVRWALDIDPIDTA